MEQVFTPEEILERQRKEATKAYANEIINLQKQEADLKVRISNLNETITAAVSQKKAELESLMDSLQEKIIGAEERESQAKVALREAVAKNEEAERLLTYAKSETENHQKNLEFHQNSVQEQSKDFASRNAVCSQREIDAEIKNKEADERIAYALKKEEETKKEIEKLSGLIEKSQTIIVAQESLKKENADEANRLLELKRSVDEKENLNNVREKEFLTIRDSLDKAQTKINKDTFDLKVRSDEWRQREIKNTVDMQRLQEMQKELSAREGKLNELKNNVDALMKEKGI